MDDQTHDLLKLGELELVDQDSSRIGKINKSNFSIDYLF